MNNSVNRTNSIFGLFLVVSLCEVVAFYLLKYHSHHNLKFPIASALLFLCIPLFLFQMLKTGHGIAMVNTAWNIISIIW